MAADNLGFEELVFRVFELSSELTKEYASKLKDLKTRTINPVITKYVNNIDLDSCYDLIEKEIYKASLFLNSNYSQAYNNCRNSNIKLRRLTSLVNRDFLNVESLDSEILKITSMKEPTPEQSYDSCSFCGSTNTFVDSRTTEYICRDCGIVDEDKKELVEVGRRAYTIDEIKNRRNNEPVYRHFGSRTMIGNVQKDARGNDLKSAKKALYSRLKKIQNSLISSLERNYWEARPKLNKLAEKINLDDRVVSETAWEIYKEVAKQKLTMGRSISDFVVSSLYASIRIHDLPRTLDELCLVSARPAKNINKSLSMVVRLVLPVLGYKYRPINPKLLVYRYGAELGLSMRVQLDTVNLLDSISAGLRSIGKDPKGIAIAALYIVAKRNNGGKERTTQTVLADNAKITEVTLRTRVKDIIKLVKNKGIII